MSELHRFTCKVFEQRELSIRVEHQGCRVYLPRSQIERLEIEGDQAVVTIPLWLYREKFGKP